MVLPGDQEQLIPGVPEEAASIVVVVVVVDLVILVSADL